MGKKNKNKDDRYRDWNNHQRNPNKPKRSIESILSCEYADYEVGDERFSQKKEKKNENKNPNNHNDQNNNNNNWSNKWDNPLVKFIKSNKPYDRKDVLQVMTKKGGLIKLIEDLKDLNGKKVDRYYSYYLIRDVVFAAALPEAIEELKEDELIDKKDISYLMDEILSFLNNSYDKNMLDRYDRETIEAMRNAYINILFKQNKKKVKKYKEIEGMDEATAKQLVVITGGHGVRSSIYGLIKYLHSFDRKKNPDFELNEKTITKIFKTSYGKSNMNEVLKYVMLEKVNPQIVKSYPGNLDNIWDLNAELDNFMLNSLMDLSKSDLEKILKAFINERKVQERDYRIQRRFNKNAIHPDDYEKIIKACDIIEEKDFSISRFLK